MAIFWSNKSVFDSVMWGKYYALFAIRSTNWYYISVSCLFRASYSLLTTYNFSRYSYLKKVSISQPFDSSICSWVDLKFCSYIIVVLIEFFWRSATTWIKPSILYIRNFCFCRSMYFVIITPCVFTDMKIQYILRKGYKFPILWM